MICRLDHVAIAVKTLQERLPFYRDLLGIPVSGIEAVPGEKVRVAILGEGAGRVELLEALDAESPVGKFIRERGEGLHHLCFVVDSLEAARLRLEQSGIRLLGGIRDGSEGTRIAFLHPRDAGGVLIEVRQLPKRSDETQGEAR